MQRVDDTYDPRYGRQGSTAATRRSLNIFGKCTDPKSPLSDVSFNFHDQTWCFVYFRKIIHVVEAIFNHYHSHRCAPLPRTPPLPHLLPRRRSAMSSTPASPKISSDKVVVREVNWDKDLSIVQSIWADGFRLIVPLYFKEIAFAPHIFGIFVAVASALSYVCTGSVIYAPVPLGLAWAAGYLWFHNTVEKSIKTTVRSRAQSHLTTS